MQRTRLLRRFLLLVALASPARGQEFILQPRWIAGGAGSAVGRFGVPESVAFDSLGRVVVTDKGRMQLHVYAARDGSPLFDVGGLGSAAGSFDRPNGIAVDGRGQVLVVEQRNWRVQVLDRDYRFAFEFGGRGSGPGKFLKPMGIALDPAGRIYVTDEARADVQVFDADGAFQWSFPQDGPRLSRVESIEVDARGGRILVCDEGKSVVNVYDLEGRYQGNFGGQGTGPGEFGNDPNAVRLDGRGRIYVNDQGNSRINVYAPDLRFLAAFRSGGGDMQSADGVAVSEAHGLLLVADQGNNRVLAFDLGEFQCRLALVELDLPAPDLGPLQVVPDARGAPPHADGWLELAGAGAPGDPTRVEQGVAHLRSRRDPRGICLRLVETGAATNRFRARVHLGDATSESDSTLAVFGADTLRAHVPDRTDEVVVPLVVLAPPEIVEARIDGRRDPEGGAVRVATDTPSVAWRFHDPAGLRSQAAYELKLVDAEGELVWESGVVPAIRPRATYMGPPLAPGRLLRLELRTGTGQAWSAWVRLPLRRNRAPRLRGAPRPANGAVLRHWPVSLVVPRPQDEDGDPLAFWFEVTLPGGAPGRVQPAVRRDTLACRAPGALAENGRLDWRLVVTDGLETTAGPWWHLERDVLPEPPEPPQLVSPADGATIHEPRVRFRWEPAHDPDPGDEPAHALEMCSSRDFDTGVREVALTGREADALEAEPDGALYWRLRATDATGHRSRSAVRRLHLSRAWTLRLRAQAGGETSEPLVLGAQASALDGFASEDTLAAPSGLQLSSLAGRDRALGVDRRALRSPGAGPFVWTLGLAGPPGAHVRLWLESSSLPPVWAARLFEAGGRGLVRLQTPGTSVEILLDSRGQARLELRVQSAAARTRPGSAAAPAGAVCVRPGARLGIARGRARADLYDVRGRRLRTGESDAGGSWTWDGRDAEGAPLVPGVYFLRGATVNLKLVWTGR